MDLSIFGVKCLKYMSDWGGASERGDFAAIPEGIRHVYEKVERREPLGDNRSFDTIVKEFIAEELNAGRLK